MTTHQRFTFTLNKMVYYIKLTRTGLIVTVVIPGKHGKPSKASQTRVDFKAKTAVMKEKKPKIMHHKPKKVGGKKY